MAKATKKAVGFAAAAEATKEDFVKAAPKAAAKADDGPKKRLSIDMPEAMHNALKVHAAKKGVNMVSIILGLVEKELSK